MKSYHNDSANSESYSKEQGSVVAALVGIILGLPGAARDGQLIHGGLLEVGIMSITAHWNIELL